MATLVVRNVDEDVHVRLKAQAAAHGRSMEEEVRVILTGALDASPVGVKQGFADAVRALFEPIGFMNLEDISREPPREPPDFSSPEWDPLA